MLAALAVLLIVGGAAVAGLLALRADTRVPVLVAAHDIPVGQLITEADLTQTSVAAEGTFLVPADRSDVVVGRHARVAISAGQLLDTTMVTEQGLLEPGLVAVGASLAPGRMPASGLQPGDVVQLVEVADGSGKVVVPDAVVSSFYDGGAEVGASGSAVVTLIVDEAAGADVAGIAADGSLAVVLVSRGGGS